MAKRRGGLSKLCSNRAREELFRQLCSMVCNEWGSFGTVIGTIVSSLFGPLGAHVEPIFGTLFSTLLGSLFGLLGAQFEAFFGPQWAPGSPRGLWRVSWGLFGPVSQAALELIFEPQKGSKLFENS